MANKQDTFATQVYPFRAASLIAFLLGAVALALTVSGMYGVMSYLVSQRTKEIGIRIALGATPGGVTGLILRQSGRLALAGITVGTLVSIGLSKLLGSLLFMPDSFDPLAYGGGLGIVTLATLAAAYLPSRRASNINPMETLRAE